MECKVRDMTMNYEEVGTGRPLLVLDGWGYSGHIKGDRDLAMKFQTLFKTPR